MEVSKLKPDNAKAIAIIIAAIAVVIIGGYFVTKLFGSIGTIFSTIGNGAKTLTDNIGLTDPADVTAAKAANLAANISSANPNSPFNPSFYKNAPTGTLLFTQAAADEIASQLYDSVGFFTTDGTEFVGAIKQCQTQSQISFVADAFYQNYGRDLWDFLSRNCATDRNIVALQQITIYAASLPKYNA